MSSDSEYNSDSDMDHEEVIKETDIKQNNIINDEPTQDQITQAIADMINSDKYTEDEINDVICGKKLPPNIKMPENKNKTRINTVGIEINDPLIKTMPLAEKAKLKQCSMCARVFTLDMITRNDETCWHCYFWMNYDIDKRPTCDGPEGLTIVQYILKCHEEHDSNNCVKAASYGDCFLCDYKLGRPILMVRDEKLLDEQKEPEQPKAVVDDLSTKTENKFKKITISI